MNKSYMITFGISALVLATVAIIALMLMIPQQVSVIEGNINKYEAIKKSEFTFESTKNISEEALLKQYTITAEDMRRFKSNEQYVAGNSDPFAPEPTNLNSGSGNGSSSSGISSSQQDADNKTTNSNGGIKNPASAGK